MWNTLGSCTASSTRWEIHHVVPLIYLLTHETWILINHLPNIIIYIIVALSNFTQLMIWITWISFHLAPTGLILNIYTLFIIIIYVVGGGLP